MPEKYGDLGLTVPKGTDEPSGADVPLAFRDYTDSLTPQLLALPVDQLANGSKKQIIVCNSSGVPQYVTASGDVTNDEAGVFTIGADKVGTSKLADKSVTAEKMGDAAIGSRKLKPTAGTKAATAPLTFPEVITLIPGTEVKLGAATASKTLVIATFDISLAADNEHTAIGFGYCFLDGVVQGSPAQLRCPKQQTMRANVCGIWSFDLAVGEHTIDLRGKVSTAAAGGYEAGSTAYTFLVISQ